MACSTPVPSLCARTSKLTQQSLRNVDSAHDERLGKDNAQAQAFLKELGAGQAAVDPLTGQRFELFTANEATRNNHAMFGQYAKLSPQTRSVLDRATFPRTPDSSELQAGRQHASQNVEQRFRQSGLSVAITAGQAKEGGNAAYTEECLQQPNAEVARKIARLRSSTHSDAPLPMTTNGPDVVRPGHPFPAC